MNKVIKWEGFITGLSKSEKSALLRALVMDHAAHVGELKSKKLRKAFKNNLILGIHYAYALWCGV
jgi:hypothetical protein